MKVRCVRVVKFKRGGNLIFFSLKVKLTKWLLKLCQAFEASEIIGRGLHKRYKDLKIFFLDICFGKNSFRLANFFSINFSILIVFFERQKIC